MKNLTVEQLMIFNRVKEIAITNNSAIKFDLKTGEILIGLPHILVIIAGNKVFIRNTNNFHTEEFFTDTILVLRKIIEREAHRDRCKLKHQGKLRIRNLITNIGEGETPCPENQEQ
jgi:hypothetical protein